MSRLLRAVKGQEGLAVVFWGYCIGGVLVVGALMLFAFRLFPAPHRQLGGVITGAGFVVYFLCAHISLWMSAFNVKKRAWGYAARCYAVLIIIYYFVGVAANFGTGSAGIHRVF